MQFLSSISGLPISAASAGYAPTNGADVSAIASAYADPKLDATASASFYPADNPSGFITGVDLTNYATTGYVDSSVSGKLDTTAFSDVSGNFLTAVPEEYATTAFVDSSVSGKLDSSASGDFYSTSNPSGFITGIDLSDYATTSYVDSSVSSKMDTAEMSSYVPFSAISADENSAITSINGSSIGGGNAITAAYRVVTYDPDLDVSSTSTATGTATGFGVIDQATAVAKDSATHVYTVKLNDNTALKIAASQLVGGTWQTGGAGTLSYPYYWLSFSPSQNAFPGSACTGYLSPCQWATGAGIMMSAGYFRGMLKANELFLSRESVLDASTMTGFQGWYIRSEAHNSRGAHMGFTSTYRSGGQYTGTGTTAFFTATADINSNGVSVSVTRQNSSAARANVTTGGFTASSTSTASSTAYMGLNRWALWFSANDMSEAGTGSSYASYGLSGIAFSDSASTSILEPSSIGYWNGKLDISAIECDTASAITAIGGSAIAGGGGGGGGVDSATVSAIASAYVESGVSGKQDSLTFGYDNAAISSINGSALAGGGTTGDYVEKSAVNVAIGTNNTASDYITFVQGDKNSAYAQSLAQGYQNTAWSESLAQGYQNRANGNSFAQASRNTAWSVSLAQGYENSANSTSFAQGFKNSAYDNAFVQGMYASAKQTAVVFGQYNLRGDGNTATGNSAAFAIGDGTASGARHDLMLVTKDGEITMYSSTADTAGTGIMSSIRAISAAATGGVDSATVSAIASAYVESGVSSKLDTTAFNSGDFYSTSNPSGFITGVDLSDYATTAYVDSSVSGKLDTTAFNSGDFYTTANESGYVGSSYVDSAVSGKADSSALSSYMPYSSLEYNTASAISGINGSALAAGSTYSAGEGIDITDDVISVEAPVDIVAGPGIVIDNPDGNTLRVSMAQAEEVVLCNTVSNSSCTLSEAYSNFERIRISFTQEDPSTIPESYAFTPMTAEFYCSDIENNAGHKVILNWGGVDGTGGAGSNNLLFRIGVWQFTSTTTFAKLLGKQFYVSWTGTDTSKLYVTRIVGIHRIAGGN